MEETITNYMLPFKGCPRCPLLEITGEALKARKDEPACVVIRCRNDYICNNAFEVWKGGAK